MLEGQAATALQHLHLAQLCERGQDFELVTEGQAGQTGQAGEELAAGVGERIAPERPEGDPAYVVQGAPDGGLGQQQQVPPGQVDGLIGSRVIGGIRPRNAPVGAVDVGDGQLQNGERPDARMTGNGIEEAAEMRLLDPLPRQPEADVHGMYDLALRSLIHHQDGAVHTAARQDDELITRAVTVAPVHAP